MVRDTLMPQTPPATSEGTTTEETTGQYGDRGCDETLHVRIDGEDVFVPFTGVRKHAYDYFGDVPETVDMNRVIVHDGRIHAESDVPGGVVELIPDYNSVTAEFQGYDRWEMKFFNTYSEEGTVIYRRDE